MKALNFYKISTITLLLVNVAMITFFLITRHAPPPNRGNKGMLKSARDIMNLSGDQDEQFLMFADKHKEQMQSLNMNQRKQLRAYFELVSHSSEQTNKEEVMEMILSLEKQKIESTYNHFEEIKGTLKEEQYADFEEFKRKALGFILLNENKNGPPPKEK